MAEEAAERRSPRSRILRRMSQENVELVLSLSDSVQNGDYGPRLELFADKILLPDLQASRRQGHGVLVGADA